MEDSIVNPEVYLRYINEGFKLNPHNPDSNGYGYVVATLAGLCLILLAVTAYLYRDQKRERKQLATDAKAARTTAAAQIDARFDKLEAAIFTALDEAEAENKACFADLQGKHAALREELVILKTEFNLRK